MNKPVASVIVPTYNRVGLLRECMLSVYRQTYRPIELLVVDDGSTDGTEKAVKEFVEEFREDDFRISYLKQDNKGPASARNAGFRASSGSFIQFLDSDDILLPQKLEEEVRYLQENNCDLVYSKAQFVNEHLNLIQGKFWGEKLTQTPLDFFNFPWQTMCALYRRETLLSGGGFVEDLLVNEDWEFNIRYILLGFKINFMESVHSLYRVHPSERIGRSMEAIEKVNSKVKSTMLVRELVMKKKLLTPELDKKYFKRLVFCAFLYGCIRAKPQKKELLTWINANFKNLTKFQRSLVESLQYSNKELDKAALQLYSIFV